MVSRLVVLDEYVAASQCWIDPRVRTPTDCGDILRRLSVGTKLSRDRRCSREREKDQAAAEN